MHQRIKIVSCTFANGGGVAAMDEALHRHLDRDAFELTTCYTPQGQAAESGLDSGDFRVVVDAASRFSTLAELFADADIVQLSGSLDPVAHDAARAAGVPTILEVIHQCEAGQRLPGIHATVCVSQAVRDCQPNTANPVLIPNGVDTTRFRPAAPGEPGRPEDRFVILQVASRSKPMHFHVDELADYLLAMDPQLELWLAGEGQTPDVCPDRSRFGGRVRYLGMVADMAPLYSQADILLQPTLREGFGLPCAEAMASGCVPVAADDGAMANLVLHGRNGWLADCRHPADVLAAVAKAIQAKTSGELALMARRAREAAVISCDVFPCIRSYEALYRRMVKENGRNRTCLLNPIQPSAEAMLTQVLFRLNNGHNLDAILGEWLEHMEDRADTPRLREPEDPFWSLALQQVRAVFLRLREFDAPQLETLLLGHLEAMAQPPLDTLPPSNPELTPQSRLN